MVQNRVRRAAAWIIGLLVTGLVFWAADVFSCSARAAGGVANLFAAINAGFSAVRALQSLSWDQTDLLAGVLVVLFAAAGWCAYRLGQPQRVGADQGSAAVNGSRY